MGTFTNSEGAVGISKGTLSIPEEPCPQKKHKKYSANPENRTQASPRPNSSSTLTTLPLS